MQYYICYILLIRCFMQQNLKLNYVTSFHKLSWIMPILIPYSSCAFSQNGNVMIVLIWFNSFLQIYWKVLKELASTEHLSSQNNCVYRSTAFLYWNSGCCIYYKAGRWKLLILWCFRVEWVKKLWLVILESTSVHQVI